MTTTPAASYKSHRFPAEMIAHAVWLTFRFPLSYRQVEEILAARGIVVSYAAIREWGRQFGPTSAPAWHRGRPQPGDQWPLAEVFLQINGTLHYLWRAVDRHGTVLDILVPAHRDRPAAQRFFHKILQRCRTVPRVLITDKLTSYGAAQRAIRPGVEHRQHQGLNNRAENALQPTRPQARQMRRVQSSGHAPRFLSAFEPITGHFRLRRHHLPAADDRAELRRRCASWNEVTGAQLAA